MCDCLLVAIQVRRQSHKYKIYITFPKCPKKQQNYPNLIISRRYRNGSILGWVMKWELGSQKCHHLIMLVPYNLHIRLEILLESINSPF